MKAKKELDLQKDINQATVKWVDEIICIADKYGCDRNETISSAAAIISLMAKISNFENYKTGRENNGR